MYDTGKFLICKDCAKDIYLKHYIGNNSNDTGKCTICLQDKYSVNINSDSNITKLSRFLIRFHYPEYEYNAHWGGDDLPKLFYSENYIISHLFQKAENREIVIEDFLYNLFGLWENDANNVLYYGHDYSGSRGLFPVPIKNEHSAIWKRYKTKLATRNYFLLEKEAKKYFNSIANELKYNLPTNSIYFRARIGSSTVKKNLRYTSFTIKIPYKGKELGAPPVNKARAGRANRSGVSFLYLASQDTTALGEVRPHPGQYVSIGQFINSRELTVADLRFINLFNYFSENDSLEMFKFLRDISHELSLPILPDEQENYLVTQFISDILRQLGFEGVLYNSSVSDGHNLVVFNSKKFSFIENSADLIKISTVSYTYKKTEYHFDNFLEKIEEK